MTEEEFAGWVNETLGEVGDRLRVSVETAYGFAQDAARYLMDAGGKRLRPGLVIAAAGLGLDSGRLDVERMLRAAVMVELTHVASLYHDDVMDEAELRRGQPTAHVRWGNCLAILVGDYMLAQASLAGAYLGQDFMVYQSQTLAALVQGQMAELRGPDPGVDPLEHHLFVVEGKTAALFAASARYGGLAAGVSPDDVEALTRYGHDLGMAFQLADDLLDIVSEESGKSPGTDLREGVPTLAPLLVQEWNRPEDARLLELLSGPVAEANIPEALALLRVHPAVDEARTQIRTWSSKASEALKSLPDTAATRSLQTLCEQAVVRTR